MPLEQPPCPLCGATASRPAYHFKRGAYPLVVRCARCPLYYLSPRPDEATATAMYQDDAYYASIESGYDDYGEQEKALSMTFRALAQRLQRLGLTGGSLLEVGCGYGYLLRETRPLFQHQEATDYAEGAVARASAHGDAVHLGGLDQVTRRDFDLALANHVIEHVYDPAAFVAEMAARVRPGGSVLLSTPDMGSLWRKAMGARWPSFKLPEHILYFNRAALSRLMGEAGLVNIRRVAYPHAFPLSLVASKLGLRLGGPLGRRALWIPGTTLALMGDVPA